jgi:hypothetical protein
MYSCYHVLPHHKPKATGSTDHGLEPLQIMTQNNLFFFIS